MKNKRWRAAPNMNQIFQTDTNEHIKPKRNQKGFLL